MCKEFQESSHRRFPFNIAFFNKYNILSAFPQDKRTGAQTSSDESNSSPGEGEPPHTHIVAEGIAAQQSEHALKNKRRRTCLFRRPRVIRGLRDVLLNIVYRFAYPCYPVNAFFSLCKNIIERREFFIPDFLCSLVSGYYSFFSAFSSEVSLCQCRSQDRRRRRPHLWAG